VPVHIEEEYDKIYRYCYYKVHDSILAEDLTQETFLKYFSQDSYIERGKRLAYLYTIARNLCNDVFRKVKSELLCTDTPVEDCFEHLEVSVIIQQALKTLPVLEQELLLLRYANELSVGEVSSILGISRFAVYRKTGSALASLKVLLKEEDFS